MSSKKFFAASVSIFLLLAIATAAWSAVEEPKAPLSMEQILEKRREVRQELMIPSLEGIRGVAYRVVGYKEFEPLEKEMGAKLANLNVPIVRLLQMQEGQKPVDAIVQVTFLKAGSLNVAELSVTQWVSLLRDPKLKVRAITYKNRIVVPHGKPGPAVDLLANEFVIDFLKANQKGTESGDKKTSSGSSAEKRKSKESDESEKKGKKK